MNLFRTARHGDGGLSIFDAVQTPSELRLQTLSDGVFAVAMTLLVLEIKLPTTETTDPSQFAAALVALWPKVGAFLLSFIILARGWELHRYVFSYVVRYDHFIVYFNMLYLMAIALLPFSTALVGDHPQMKLAAAIYAGNFLFIGGTKLVIWSYATHNNRLVPKEMPPVFAQWLKRRLILSSCVICIAILLAFVYPAASILLLLVYQVGMILLPFFRPPKRTFPAVSSPQ
jgi:uncharacterized membrane protein